MRFRRIATDVPRINCAYCKQKSAINNVAMYIYQYAAMWSIRLTLFYYGYTVFLSCILSPADSSCSCVLLFSVLVLPFRACTFFTYVVTFVFVTYTEHMKNSFMNEILKKKKKRKTACALRLWLTTMQCIVMYICLNMSTKRQQAATTMRRRNRKKVTTTDALNEIRSV